LQPKRGARTLCARGTSAACVPGTQDPHGEACDDRPEANQTGGTSAGLGFYGWRNRPCRDTVTDSGALRLDAARTLAA